MKTKLAFLVWLAYTAGHVQGWNRGRKSGRMVGLLEAQQLVANR